ncbi:hypothetical protein B0A48_11232 [Cryoendolithus antarcticus]|uniref:Uncharacterized protein n=1 Tax=Cryoendolithus antarcticus TaxID=1507870 RepID=A0A1V8SV49_9PEZI|nr:hypothetical protein B0A48_11232 [Cryoendolithus antarcticus]
MATCCPHPRSRALSPTEPPRLTTIPLNSLFTFAALPEDHPHALRFPKRRADSAAAKGVGRKVSLSKRLLGGLRRRKTWKDVVGEMSGVEGSDAVEVRSGELRDVWDSTVEGGDGENPQGRDEGRQSKTSENAPKLRLRRISSLRSSPDLRRLRLDSVSPTRRPRSSFELRARVSKGPSAPDLANELRPLGAVDFGTPTAISNIADQEPDITDLSAPTPLARIAEQALSVGSLEVAVQDAADKVESEEAARPPTSTSIHLTTLQISEQLRSLSQMSDSAEQPEHLTPEPWAYHRRQRSIVEVVNQGNVSWSGHARHLRQMSGTGAAPSQVSNSWARPAKDRDTSSSIYSRATSPDVPAPAERPTKLEAWPLIEASSPAKLALVLDGAVDEVPTIPQQYEAPAAKLDPALIALLSSSSLSSLYLAPPTAPERTASIRSSASNVSKRSRFLERFTPPKKLVKKRKSFFMFLRPGSKRQHQTRSISTPTLGSRPINVDGAAYESDSLTVQYELNPPAADRKRSASTSKLPSITLAPATSSPDLARKPSLIEYERKLSVVGDDRRRPSNVDIKRLSAVQEDNMRRRSTLRKSISRRVLPRAPENALMDAALERHLAEKALFQSSKRHSTTLSSKVNVSAPDFGTTTWSEPSITGPDSPEHDPLDSIAATAQRLSNVHLSPPRTPIDGRSRTSTVTTQPGEQSLSAPQFQTPSSVSQKSTVSKIGSSLASWSRFPSHSRLERVGSAGPADNVIARDFAFESDGSKPIDPAARSGPAKRTLTGLSIASSKFRLQKSRSATFGGIKRYYSSLFSRTDFQGKGRRTSVAMGGSLENPELEVLPPVMPHGTHSAPVLGDVKPRHGHGVDRPRAKISSEAIMRAELGAGDVHPALREADDKIRAESSLFVHKDPFHHLDQHHERQNSSIDPADEISEQQALLPTQDQRQTSNGLTHDGAADHLPPSPPHKAEVWCGVYKDCLVRPVSPDDTVLLDTITSLLDSAAPESVVMGPPTLKPFKSRSPQQQPPVLLDPGATVRRFPSVTVVDDRKGHWRSVSFISVQSGKSGGSGSGFLRESSNDLLRLMEVKEREGREKLMAGVLEESSVGN